MRQESQNLVNGGKVPPESESGAKLPGRGPAGAGPPGAAPAQEEAPPPAPREDEAAAEGIGAFARLFLDESCMTAEILVDAPGAGGADVTLEELEGLLRQKGVVYGIDEEALAQLASPLYGRRLVVARGSPLKHGTDGSCTERFSREAERLLAQRADGSVDHRELGLIRDIKEGTVLCDITLPVPGEHGKDVRGAVLKAKDGVKAAVPKGEGTRLSEDGLRLQAAHGGNLVFRNGGFAVEKVVRVQNVDYDTGNITFSGDVQINGDVVDGFEVKAGGNIVLYGNAGAVALRAGKDIIVQTGLNGTGKAVLEAGRTLKAGFIENCSLLVGEKLIAQTLINCRVECEGDVDVSGGKGVICGGKITAFGSVKAKVVGNESNTMTVVTMGVTPRLLKERRHLAEQFEEVGGYIDEMTKSVEYIERLVKDGRPVPPERVKMLKRVQLVLPMTKKRHGQLRQRVAELDEKLLDVHGAVLTAGIIYPPTKLSIGALSTNVTDKRQNCRVYKNEAGELTFGSA